MQSTCAPVQIIVTPCTPNYPTSSPHSVLTARTILVSEKPVPRVLDYSQSHQEYELSLMNNHASSYLVHPEQSIDLGRQAVLRRRLNLAAFAIALILTGLGFISILLPDLNATVGVVGSGQISLDRFKSMDRIGGTGLQVPGADEGLDGLAAAQAAHHGLKKRANVPLPFAFAHRENTAPTEDTTWSNVWKRSGSVPLPFAKGHWGSSKDGKTPDQELALPVIDVQPTTSSTISSEATATATPIPSSLTVQARQNPRVVVNHPAAVQKQLLKESRARLENRRRLLAV